MVRYSQRRVHLIPEQNDSLTAPTVRIAGLRIAHRLYPIGENGIQNSRFPNLQASQNHIHVEFSGISFAPGDALRYQYLLEGLDQQWSPPSA